jgi:hypothetical protein
LFVNPKECSTLVVVVNIEGDDTEIVDVTGIGNVELRVED